ncbi:MAG: preprotein translocase subunit SecG [Chloroflexi bacterium]|nr:preprotein translocase subunit SecG [Chloroflexota bacterium]
MSVYFNLAQIIISIVLVGVILLQTRNSGLGSTFGSDSIYTTRRGLDQTLHQLTVILAVLFCVVSLVSVLFQ